RWNWKIQEIPDITVLLNDRLTVHPTQKKVGAKLNLREVRRSSQRTKRRLDFKDGEATTKEVIWKGRHKDLERSCTSRKSVAPTRNRILLYPDSDEEDEDYCSLPPLLPCFQTPQPCATLKPVHHNNHNEVDIESMTLEE
ncbi:hypothetical protein Tco_0591661, partial [Tanacetum coccineum]